MSIRKPTLKLVLAGDGGVGKTTMVYNLIGKQTITRMTRGVSIETLKIDVDNGKQVKVVCWDLGGQPQFRFFLEDFLGGADLALFVFDLNRYSSLKNLEEDWVPMFQKEVPNLKKAVMVGNKLDLGQTIDDEEIERIAGKLFMTYIKVSAKEGTNLDKIIEIIEDLGYKLRLTQ